LNYIHISLFNYQGKMAGVLNKREPKNTRRIHQYPPVVEIFTRLKWMGFFERMRG